MTDLKARAEALRNSINIMKKLHIPMTFIAKEADVSDTLIHLFMSGDRNLSESTLEKLEAVTMKYSTIARGIE